MQGQGGYQILDYREFTSENYEKIYNLITTNKMYLIEHFKTDEVEEISLFLTAIKNENDITFLYNNKTQTLVYDKSGITNNLGQGGGSGESKYKIIQLGNISNGSIISDEIILEIMKAYTEQLIIYFYFTYSREDYLVAPMYENGKFTFYITISSVDENGTESFVYNNLGILLVNKNKIYIYEENVNQCIRMSGNSLDIGSTLTIEKTFDLVSLISEGRFSLNAYIFITQEGGPTKLYYTPIFYGGTDTKYYELICETRVLLCSLTGQQLLILGIINLTPKYNTLQVSGIESITVNSSLTTSIQSLTDKNTTITSIKPSVAGVIVSAPYFDETDNCYKTTIFNATTSAVSDLTLTIDYYTLTQD